LLVVTLRKEENNPNRTASILDLSLRVHESKLFELAPCFYCCTVNKSVSFKLHNIMHAPIDMRAHTLSAWVADRHKNKTSSARANYS